jgi:hypothetical protein
MRGNAAADNDPRASSGVLASSFTFAFSTNLTPRLRGRLPRKQQKQTPCSDTSE